MPYLKVAILDILQAAVNQEASDVHIKVGVPPVFRIQRDLQIQTQFPEITDDDALEYLDEITTDEQREKFNDNLELDFAYSIPGGGRFRVNVYCELGMIGLVFRLIKPNLPSFQELGLPEILAELSLKKSGLIILTGPGGCGKTTTLAAMLNYMNENVKRKIIAIEDPVEYLHESHRSIISQRELGSDTKSFADALRHVIRQDPEVIVIGEMRDTDSMSIALSAAETGHLVLTTLHTPNSRGAIEYIVGSYPVFQRDQILLQLASTLEAVVYQILLPRLDYKGLVPVVEILLATPAVKQLIRDNKLNQIITYMQTSKGTGMQTMEQSIEILQKRGVILNSLT